MTADEAIKKLREMFTKFYTAPSEPVADFLNAVGQIVASAKLEGE